jgi:hypothetical protein
MFLNLKFPSVSFGLPKFPKCGGGHSASDVLLCGFLWLMSDYFASALQTMLQFSTLNPFLLEISREVSVYRMELKLMHMLYKITIKVSSN